MATRLDFPFYNGQPIALDGRSWLLLLVAVGLAFAVLVLLPLRSFPANLIPALLFLMIPLLSLRLVAGSHWAALFRRVGVREIGLMVGFALLTLIGSLAVGFLMVRVIAVNPNPVSDAMGTLSGLGLIMMLLPTVPQLIGEELLGIVPFLAMMWLCFGHLHMSKLASIVIALIISGLIFGAAHLPTYGWNWGQALIGIGATRIFLTLGYIATRNLWVSAGAHILNDWTGFLFVFAAGHAPIGADL